MNMKLAAFAAISLFFMAAPANAEDGPWRVGETYVVRPGGLDLDRAEDRRRLLDAVEEGAARLCKDAGPHARRVRCEAEAVENALAAAPRAREAVALARSERDGVQIAHRR